MITGRAVLGGDQYHKKHLKANDYYEKNKEVQGIWVGNACEPYGITPGSFVSEHEFESLRTNKHPITGEQITLRQNTTRIDPDGNEVNNRRAFYDFTISAPKSISILGITFGEKRAVQWHNAAVQKVLKEIEYWISRQDHHNPEHKVERTGKFAAACFQHDANRALEPNLHDHIVIFNMTPSKNNNSYAIEFNELFQRIKYFNAIYRDALAKEAINAGAFIEIDKQGAPQIKTPTGSLQAICEHFSSRTKDKERLVKLCESLIGSKLTNNEVTIIVRNSRGFKSDVFEKAYKDSSFGKSRDQIIQNFAALVKACSDGGMIETTTEDVIRQQKESLSEEQTNAIHSAISCIDGSLKQSTQIPSINEGLKYAIEDRFENRSVAYDYEIYERALVNTCGNGTNIQKLKGLLDQRCQSAMKKIVRVGNEITTLKHLEQELEVIKWISESEEHESLNLTNFTPSESLNEEQLQATNDILTSKGRISVLVGQAGTGKTFTTSEIVRANLENGHWVYMVAPSNGARDVLRADGEKLKNTFNQPKTALPFLQANSLQLLLADQSLQESIPKDSLVILDEAGLASMAQMHQLLKVSRYNGWRILLVGDPKQHTSVEAGDALRIILRNSTATRTRLTKIQRQKTHSYREVAQDLASGATSLAFNKMDTIGAIQEVRGNSYTQALANAYLEHYNPDDKKSAILVTPTHKAINEVSIEIRKKLRSQGLLEVDESKINTLRDLSWSFADKKVYQNFKKGLTLFVNSGKNKGKAFQVIQPIRGKGIQCLSLKGKTIFFTKQDMKNISVCEEVPLPFSIGDKIMNRVGTNTRSGEVINGEVLTFNGLDAQGNIKTQEGKTLRHKRISYAYASTSHKSQGDTYKNVLIGFDKDSIRTVTQKLAYVAATRGQMGIKLLVENKEDLQKIEPKSGDRKSALELLESRQKKAKVSETRVDRISVALKSKKQKRAELTQIGINRQNPSMHHKI